jgi:hypothetical protein
MGLGDTSQQPNRQRNNVLFAIGESVLRAR